jgi:hypothetical protein
MSQSLTSTTYNTFEAKQTIAPTIDEAALVLKRGITAGTSNIQESQTEAGVVLTKTNAKGVFFPVQAATNVAPAYVKGGLYFDTTENKLYVGGATAWEKVTSV